MTQYQVALLPITTISTATTPVCGVQVSRQRGGDAGTDWAQGGFGLQNLSGAAGRRLFTRRRLSAHANQLRGEHGCSALSNKKRKKECRVYAVRHHDGSLCTQKQPESLSNTTECEACLCGRDAWTGMRWAAFSVLRKPCAGPAAANPSCTDYNMHGCKNLWACL